MYFCLAGYNCVIIIFNDDDAKVDIAGTAYISGLQTELHLFWKIMQIVRTLRKLGYRDRELASYFIIGIVFQIEFAI